MNWSAEVIFTEEYADNFSEKEKKERKDSEYRFLKAISRIIKETGIVPVIGDWVYPISKSDYPLDIGRISGRDFYPEKRIIRFEIS